jgi:adenosylmethionine-8-amino-7-oxononanoate aminotransferase
MSVVDRPDRTQDELDELAARHLWLQYTPMGAYGDDRRIPVVERGEGCYVYDSAGKRYLDALSGLFCVNVGHGRERLARAAAEQMSKLAFSPNWSRTHPPAIRLAARIAELAPGDLDRVFFTSGGSEAVESAIKLARNYHKVTGNPTKTKVIARQTAYHGTTLGALAATGITSSRVAFEPLVPGGCHVPSTNLYRLPAGLSPDDLAETIEQRIVFEGPETVAAVILEPVQSAGGCFTPPDGYFARVREICDRHQVLLISDEVICAWGRLGHWFGCERYGYQPDMITTAKGVSSGYAPLGALIASERLFEPFAGAATFEHGFTFAGHPVACAVALENLAIFEEEQLNERVRAHEGQLHDMLDSLRDIPLVGDVRGAGYFWAIELVRDRETKAGFAADEIGWLLRDLIGDVLFERGLVCRADNRGDPVITLSPPLIAGPEQFAEIEAVLRPVLEQAWQRLTAA